MYGLNVSKADLDKAADEIIRELLGDLSQAVAEETRGLEQDLEKITRMAVPGKLWRAWTSKSYPRAGKPAAQPRGEIWINGGRRSVGALTYFTQKGRISNANGFWLAIPTPAAGARGRARDLTPGEWEKRTGRRLKFIYRRGRPGLLVDEGTTNARTGHFRAITRKRTKADERRGFVRGAQTIIIFVLLPYVDFSPRFSIAPVIERRESSLARTIEGRIGHH